MHKARLAGVAAAALLGLAPIAASAQSWQGVYFTTNVGGGQLSASGGSGSYYGDYEGYGPVNATDWGAEAGAGVGVNFQFGSGVFGIEGDWNWSSLSATLDSYDDTYYLFHTRWNWFSTIRARAGVAVDNALIYVTGGLALVNANYDSYYYDDMTPNTYDFHSHGNSLGLAIGAGAEFAIGGGNSRVRLEYLHIGLPSVGPVYSDYASSGPYLYYNTFFESSANIFRAGFDIGF